MSELRDSLSQYGFITDRGTFIGEVVHRIDQSNASLEKDFNILMTIVDEKKARDIRLINFTSTLRSLDVFSNARIDQSYRFFLEYEEYRKNFIPKSENLIIRQYIKETFNK